MLTSITFESSERPLSEAIGVPDANEDSILARNKQQTIQFDEKIKEVSKKLLTLVVASTFFETFDGFDLLRMF